MTRSLLPLLVARDKIKQFADTLDVSSSPCPCCERVVYTNLTDKRAHEVLVGMVERLDRQINGLIIAAEREEDQSPQA